MLPPSLQICAINKSCSFDYSWLIQERMSSYSTTTEPLSRLWSRWWGRNGTGWMRTALSCTTSTWSSYWPCAQRARTSTRRSSATPCSHWMTLSAWWPTRTASPRWVTLSPGWVGPAHVSPRGVWGCGWMEIFRWPRWDLTVLTPAAHFAVRFPLAETASSWALVLGERNDGGSKFFRLSPWRRTGNCWRASALWNKWFHVLSKEHWPEWTSQKWEKRCIEIQFIPM